MDRRTLLLASLGTAMAGAVAAEPARGRRASPHSAARPPAAPAALAALVETFPGVELGHDGFSSCVVLAGDTHVDTRPTSGAAPLWRAERAPDAPAFAGSALNGVLLAAFLRQEEDGNLSRNDLAVVDDSVRSLPSPVFKTLTGRAPHVSVLEAMVVHADNTAADVASAAVGPDAIRKLILAADLKQTRLPPSSRGMINWFAGGAADVDPGWEGLQELYARPKIARLPQGDGPFARSTAAELAAWSQAAFSGRLFSRKETLEEFGRIMAMGAAVRQVAPADIPVWGAGGRFDCGDFHSFALAGRMIAAGVPVTFSMIASWRGDGDAARAISLSCHNATRAVLEQARRSLEPS